jgi:hypothetical protein
MNVLPGLPIHATLAQLSPRQERLNAVDGFVMMFVQPKQICAIAGGIELAGLNSILGDIRKEYLPAFQAVEKSNEYAATIAAMKLLDDDSLKSLNQDRARTECSRRISQLQLFRERANLKERFKYLLELFSQPI